MHGHVVLLVFRSHWELKGEYNAFILPMIFAVVTSHHEP